MDVLIYGASGGIGKALCKKLDSQGAKICLVGRSEEKLQRLRNELTQDKHLICTIESLTTDSGFKKTLNQLKQLDFEFSLGVHAVGQGFSKKIADTGLAEWNQIMDVNLTSAFMFSKLFLELRHSSNYDLVYFGSQSTNESWPKNSLYGSSKAALEYFVNVLQKEVRPSGGRVWLYQAGSVNTDFFKNMKNHLPPEKMIQPTSLATMVVNNLATDSHLYLTNVPVRSD